MREIKQSVQLLQDAQKCIREVLSTHHDYNFYKEQYPKLRDEIKELKKKLDEAQFYQRRFGMILPFSTHCICDECLGAGGHETEYGGEVCLKCNESGVISKELLNENQDQKD